MAVKSLVSYALNGQPGVSDVLCGDDFGQRCQVRLWMVCEVGWSDPHAVAGAGVAVVAQ